MGAFISDKTLLFIGGGIEAIPGIQTAKQMGLRVAVSDMNPEAPGLRHADDPIVADTYDIEATLDAARKYLRQGRKIDGVMCIASDVPLTVATVARELNLPGIPVEAAELSMHKLKMKEKFLSDGVPVPWFSEIKNVGELRECMVQKGCPLVIKPVDSRGARGVVRITEDVDPEWAFQYALDNSPSDSVILEEFLEGPQVSTESVMIDGRAYTPGFSDRNYEYLGRYAPNIIENGGDLPSFLPDSIQEEVKSHIQKAALSMGIKNGTVKGDIVIHQNKPYVIELAARLSGGYFCSHEIPLNTGVQFVEQAIRLALGEKIAQEDLAPKFKKYISQRYLFPAPGKVVSMAPVEKIREKECMEFFNLRLKIGDVIPKMENHPARAGVVICSGDSREEAIRNANLSIEDLDIRTVPV